MRKRLFLILALAVLVSQGTLLTSFVQCDACASGTSDDDCSSSCETCLCCTMARVVMPASTGARALAPVGAVFPSPLLPRSSADPRDIFHVPKPSLS